MNSVTYIWKFMELKLAAGCLEEDEVNECTDDALAVIEGAMIPLIKFNMFAWGHLLRQ
jgi:hypothetical protein